MKNKTFTRILSSIFSAVILCAGTVACSKAPAPTVRITPLGDSVITVEYGTQYEDPGAEGTYTLQEETGATEVTTLGAVDTSVTGSYFVKYIAHHAGITATAYRRVDVVDTAAPTITLTGEANASSGYGLEYREQGFTATDEYDGDITHRVLRWQTAEKVYYSVTDAAGNTATVHRWIAAYDNTAPALTLNNGSSCIVLAGVPFTDPGWSALDNRDGDLTAQVSISGEVDIRNPGEYYLTYTITDRSGNTATAERTVSVQAQTAPEVVIPEGKVIYLTFDDGPGPYTEQLLSLLSRYNVKATFFVVNNDFKHLLKRIVDEGHSIGVHANVHVFKQVYASDEAFLDDLFTMQDVIETHTGVRTTLMRFPGGGSNTVSKKYCKGIMTRLTKKVEELGFQYFDWNVDSKDAGGAKSADTVFMNVLESAMNKQTSIVLQHDIKSYSVEAVEKILNWGLTSGYTFLPLQPNSPGFHHNVNN